MAPTPTPGGLDLIGTFWLSWDRLSTCRWEPEGKERGGKRKDARPLYLENLYREFRQKVTLVEVYCLFASTETSTQKSKIRPSIHLHIKIAMVTPMVWLSISLSHYHIIGREIASFCPNLTQLLLSNMDYLKCSNIAIVLLYQQSDVDVFRHTLAIYSMSQLGLPSN